MDDNAKKEEEGKQEETLQRSASTIRYPVLCFKCKSK